MTDASTETSPEAVFRNKGRNDTDWVTVPSPFGFTSANVDNPLAAVDTCGGVGIGAGPGAGGITSAGTTGAGPGSGGVDTAAGTGPDPGNPGNGSNGKLGTGRAEGTGAPAGGEGRGTAP